MADAFIGEIRMFPFGFNPVGWYPCSGQQMVLAQNVALYSLLGINFGGDGRTYFNLPNLNGRIPLSAGTAQTGTTYVLGKTMGQETVTLSYPQGPVHNHLFADRLSSATTTGMTGVATTTGTGGDMVGNSRLSRALTSAGKTINAYDVPPSSDKTQLGVKVSSSCGNAQGGVDPHPNIQPYLVMGYYICGDNGGTYPPRPD
jgi:microcystin-dependent protein